MSRKTSSKSLLEKDSPVDQLRIRNAKVLQRLVQSHLSQFLDLSDDQLDSLVSATEKLTSDNKPKDAKESKEWKNNKKNQVKVKTISGAPLTEEGVCQLYQLIAFIGRDYNIVQEGLFRKQGSASRQQDLKYMINSGATIDLDANRYTVHDCCCVLKAFISDLPQVLINNFKYHMQVQEMNAEESTSPARRVAIRSKQIKTVQLLMLLLPEVNRLFLKDIFILLNNITKHEESNKMNARNLASLLTPIKLLCVDDNPNFTVVQLHQNLSRIATALEFIITYANQIFMSAPTELSRDAQKALDKLNSREEKAEKSDDELDVVDSCITFCRPQQPAEDFTQIELAKLYAHVQALPPSTPGRDRYIKRFNKANTPIVKSEKKNALGQVFRAGHHFLRASGHKTKKQLNNDNEEKSVSPCKNDQNKDLRQKYKRVLEEMDSTSPKVRGKKMSKSPMAALFN